MIPSIRGIVNAYPLEYDVVNFAVNASFGLNNVSITLKHCNLTNEANLVNQGKMRLNYD